MPTIVRRASIHDSIGSIRSALRIVQRQVCVKTDALEDWLGHCSPLHFVVPARRPIELPASRRLREQGVEPERRMERFLKTIHSAAAGLTQTLWQSPTLSVLCLPWCARISPYAQ